MDAELLFGFLLIRSGLALISEGSHRAGRAPAAPGRGVRGPLEHGRVLRARALPPHRARPRARARRAPRRDPEPPCRLELRRGLGTHGTGEAEKKKTSRRSQRQRRSRSVLSTRRQGKIENSVLSGFHTKWKNIVKLLVRSCVLRQTLACLSPTLRLCRW